MLRFQIELSLIIPFRITQSRGRRVEGSSSLLTTSCGVIHHLPSLPCLFALLGSLHTLFNNFYFCFRQLIKIVNQLVDLLISGINLALQNRFIMPGFGVSQSFA